MLAFQRKRLQLVCEEFFITNDATFELFTSLSFSAYAKQKHLTLFDKIAAEHAKIGEEQLAARLAFEATSIRYEEEEEDSHM